MALAERSEPLSFGNLKDLTFEIVNRGRDGGQSEDIKGHCVNAAEQYICTELGGDCPFLNTVEEIIVPASTGEYTFSEQVRDVRTIRDETNRRTIAYVIRERWNAYIGDPEATTGPPIAWTKKEYIRRTNAESPNEPYGRLTAEFWPMPTDDHTLFVDEMLRPGHMVYDGDLPVLPTQWHQGLVHLAAVYGSTQDVGSKAYQENSRLADMWIRAMRRETQREMAGSQHFVTREEYERRRSGSRVGPPTRLGQLLP